MSIRKAAKRYGVPKSSLNNRLNEKNHIAIQLCKKVTIPIVIEERMVGVIKLACPFGSYMTQIPFCSEQGRSEVIWYYQATAVGTRWNSRETNRYKTSF